MEKVKKKGKKAHIVEQELKTKRYLSPLIAHSFNAKIRDSFGKMTSHKCKLNLVKVQS